MIRDPNWSSPAELAEAFAPSSVRPLAGTLLPTDLGMFSFPLFFAPSISLLTWKISFKIADEISANFAALGVLIHYLSKVTRKCI